MNSKPAFEELFEKPILYPDADFKERLNELVGLDDQKQRLIKIISILVNREKLLEWAKKHHPNSKKVISTVMRRPPLVVMAGDVGSGKTELALTIGDAIARTEKINITLFPMSLSTRGQGRVGEMTQLISAAFDYTIEQAEKLKGKSGSSKGAVILLVDEADALGQSRETSQMHHEDKAGVNAFIRGVDRIGNGKLPAAVIMCTNRIGAIDPAIKRRAADILSFNRPNDKERHEVLDQPLKELGFSEKEIGQMVSITGAHNGRDYGFTFSDLTQRLIPSIILDAYPDRAVTTDEAIEIAKNLIPTSPFKETEL
ncbi:MAG: AAA family ATPase [Chitinophagales bacterium]|nr:AAA family ATPase [Chitinophagales bacterium]